MILAELLERRSLLSDAPSFGDDLPRYLTDAEKKWIAEHPEISSPVRVPTAPPTGPIDPVAEYDPMEGLVISWLTYGGTTASPGILAQITKRVTVEGNARMYIGVTSSTVQSSATSILNAAGANLANVTFFTVPLNSVWARDYGPRYVYEGDVRVITDHRYNRPTRPQDDNQPVVFGQFKKHQYYEIGLSGTTLVHGGGNYHLASDGDAYATQLVVNENPTFTSSQIQQIWSTYQNNNVTITQPFPTSVDATQHIDMWMQIYGDKKAFISDWPNNVGSTQDVICDNTAALMQSRGYEVTRIPAYSIGGVHYTFANMVVMNNIVLLPQYNNGPGATVSNNVFSQVQAAFSPLGKTVYQINGDSIVTAAGVFHCIVQHVPVHRGLPGPNGGLAPTAYLRGPNTAVSLQAGAQFNIEWISDDDAPVGTAGVQGVDLLLSTDGGLTFPTVIASNQPANGSFLWTIPAGINTTQARLRVVARDSLNNTGFDDNDANFSITQAISATPAAPSLSPSSDTGVSSSDGITKNNNSGERTRLTFNVGGTIAGATINLYADGALIGTAVATGTTTSVETDGSTVLADGARNFTARQVEPGRAESASSATTSITIDTAAPTASSPAFLFETLPHVVQFSFSENVGPTVAAGDLTISDQLGGPTVAPDGVSYGGANVASFSITAGLADSRFRATLAGITDIAGNALANDGQFDFHFLRGDATGDASVNIADFSVLASRFNLPGTFSQGDFNYNGTTEIGDFSILASRFNTSLPAARRGSASIPAAPPAPPIQRFSTNPFREESNDSVLPR